MSFITTCADLPANSIAYVSRNAVTGKQYDPPQPCLILRKATRQEFRQHYLNSDLRETFLALERDEHPVPEDYNFYEVATD